MGFFALNLALTISPNFKDQEIQNSKQTTTEVNSHNLLVWNFVHHLTI